MANGMNGSIVPSSPLGNGFILFYFLILCVLRRTDGSCNYGSTVGYYVLLVVS